MYYIADNPWPLMILFSAVAFVGLASGIPKGRTIAVAGLLLAVAVYFVEQHLVSAGEEVEAEAHQMLENFQVESLAAVTQQIMSDKPSLIAMAKRGMERVDLSPDFHIKSVEVELKSEARAEALIRANGDLVVQPEGVQARLPNYWRTIWLKKDDSWKLSEVTRLNPVNGEEIPVFGGH